MYRLFAIALLVAACSSDDGGDDSAPDSAGGGGGGDTAIATPNDGPGDPPPGDAQANNPEDAGDPADANDPIADQGPDPDMALPDAAAMFEMGLGVGQQPPDFTLPNADGDQVSMSDFRGGYAVVVGTSVW